MNAVLKTKPTQPRSAASVRGQIARLEGELALARRTQNATIASRPTIDYEGDEDALRLADQTLAECESRINGLLEQITKARATLAVAEERERRVERLKTVQEVETRVAGIVERMHTWALKVDGVGRDFVEISTEIRLVCDMMTRAGIQPDPREYPHCLHPRLVSLLEHMLFLATGGYVGKSHTLNGPEQIARKVTSASVIKHETSEFAAMTLRRARDKLNI